MSDSACSEALGDRDGKAGADTERKPDDQKIQGAGHADAGKGIQAKNTADKDAVGEVVKLLEQVPDQQRNTEAQNTLQRGTCCHIFYHGSISFPIPENSRVGIRTKDRLRYIEAIF